MSYQPEDIIYQPPSITNINYQLDNNSKYYKPCPNKTYFRYQTYYYPFFNYPDYYFASVYPKTHKYKYIPETEYNYIEGFDGSNKSSLFNYQQILLIIILLFLIFFIMI